MVKLLKLKLEGFFGIVDVEINLDAQGLVLVTGVNGSGKTALIVEGLYYALYGRSFEYGKMPAEKVVNWRVGGMLTEITLSVDDCPWVIRRSRNHSEHGTGISLFQWAGKKWADRTLGTSGATQQKIDALLNITAEGFASSVVFSTDLLRFPDYPDAEKKKIIEGLLHLNEADVALVRVKDARQVKLREKELVDRDWQNAYDQLTRTQKKIEELQAVTEFEGEAEIGLNVAKIEEIKGLAERQAAETNRAIAENVEQLEAYRTRLREVADLLVSKNNARATVAAQLSAATRELELERADLQSKAKRARTALTTAEKDLAEHACPTCLRDWGEEHKATLTAERDRIAAMIPQIADALTDIGNEIEAAALPFTATAADLANEIRLVTEERSRLTVDIQKQDTKLARLRQQLGDVAHAHAATIAYHTKEIATLRAEQSRIEGTLAERENRLEEIYAEVAEQEAKCYALQPQSEALALELDDLQILLECFGPKGARVLLLQSAAPALNAYAAEAAEIIAPGITVQFLVDEETKGRVDIAVDNANGARQYHGNSGGERRKVDLVVLFALMRLSTVRMNVLVVDEAFEKLSEDAQQLIASYLRHLSREIPSIFMINHTALSLSSAADQIWHMDRGLLVSQTDNRR